MNDASEGARRERSAGHDPDPSAPTCREPERDLPHWHNFADLADRRTIHQRTAAAAEEGVYVLANDAVADWLSACAASLRSFNPDLRVVVIAYDDRLRTVRRLCDQFGFELWHDQEFDWLDEVAGKLEGDLPPQRMRKLAAFWGPLERFLYLDVDTIVLMKVQSILTATREHPESFLFAHCDELGGNLDEVYRPGKWREDFLAAHGSHAGNAGLWAGSRGVFSRADLADLAEAARPIAGEFVYPYQGFLNFCLDCTAKSVRNLHEFIDVPLLWAGVSGYVESDGTLSDPQGGPVGLVHWAGYELNAQLPYQSLWDHWATAASPTLRDRARRWISSQRA
jgi:hypothetical protein